MKYCILLLTCTIGITTGIVHARTEMPAAPVVPRLSVPTRKLRKPDLREGIQTLRTLNVKELSEIGIRNIENILADLANPTTLLNQLSHLTELMNIEGIGETIKLLFSDADKSKFLQTVHDLHTAGITLSTSALKKIKTYTTHPFNLQTADIKDFITNKLNTETVTLLLDNGLNPENIRTLLTQKIDLDSVKKLMLGKLPTLNEAIKTFQGNFYNLLFVPAILNKLLGLANLKGPSAASVAHGNALSPEEQSFRVQRLPKVRTHLETMRISGCAAMERFEIEPFNRTPIIAVCASGGGARAMIGTLGGYIGLQDVGILNLITYAAVLSGGSWGTFPWVLSESGNPRDQLNAVKSAMTKANDPMKISLTNPVFTPRMLKKMQQYFARKLIAGQPITFVDLYGYLIAKTVLPQYGKNKYSKAMSANGQEPLVSGDRLLPIGTAIIGREPSQETNTFLWLEITPWTVGSHDLASYIPTNAFGEKFDRGHSVQQGPPPPVSNWIGLMGSAFAANIDYFKEEKTGNKFIDSLIAKDAISDVRIRQQRVGGVRPLAAWINNFTRNDEQLPAEHAPYKQAKELVLADAGLDYNLPFAPLVERRERAVDMIIVLDSSAGLKDGEAPGELVKAINYFKKKGVNFPEAELEELKNFASPKISVLKNNDLTIMYIPIICDSGDTLSEKVCDTFNFTYTPEQVEKLSMIARKLIVENKCLLYKEIQEIITRK